MAKSSMCATGGTLVMPRSKEVLLMWYKEVAAEGTRRWYWEAQMLLLRVLSWYWEKKPYVLLRSTDDCTKIILRSTEFATEDTEVILKCNKSSCTGDSKKKRRVLLCYFEARGLFSRPQYPLSTFSSDLNAS